LRPWRGDLVVVAAVCIGFVVQNRSWAALEFRGSVHFVQRRVGVMTGAGRCVGVRKDGSALNWDMSFFFQALDHSFIHLICY
jgi:hypothetical protein